MLLADRGADEHERLPADAAQLRERRERVRYVVEHTGAEHAVDRADGGGGGRVVDVALKELHASPANLVLRQKLGRGRHEVDPDHACRASLERPEGPGTVDVPHAAHVGKAGSPCMAIDQVRVAPDEARAAPPQEGSDPLQHADLPEDLSVLIGEGTTSHLQVTRPRGLRYGGRDAHPRSSRSRHRRVALPFRVHRQLSQAGAEGRDRRGDPGHYAAGTITPSTGSTPARNEPPYEYVTDRLPIDVRLGDPAVRDAVDRSDGGARRRWCASARGGLPCGAHCPAR